MGLLKKLKKVHKKTIAHKLASKDPLLGKLMGGKKKKGGSSTAPTAAAGPQTAKARLEARPALARNVAASQAAVKPKPMQTGGGAQKTPVTTKPMQTGGPGQMNPAARPMLKPGLRTGGPMRPMGGGLSRPSSAGSSLARIAKGYKNR